MQKITTFLWFDNQAEEAANFYTSIFKNSKIVTVTHYGDSGAAMTGKSKGSVMTVVFQLDGQEFIAINGGPHFTFTPAISLVVNCKSQEEIDEMWDKLSEGGQPGQCGWLNDRYGISWQIVPAVIEEMLSDPDAAKSERVMQAVLQMKKLDIKTLEQAYNKK